MKVLDITLSTGRGARVEIDDDFAECLQEALTDPGLRFIGIPGIRHGVELSLINIEHIVEIDIESPR